MSLNLISFHDLHFIIVDHSKRGWADMDPGGWRGRFRYLCRHHRGTGRGQGVGQLRGVLRGTQRNPDLRVFQNCH